jgi:hypothetical protein
MQKPRSMSGAFLWRVGLVFWLTGRVSNPTGDGDRHPRPFITSCLMPD